MRKVQLLLLLPLVACQGVDWKPLALREGEEQIRHMISDPAATFSEVQVVGDRQTGQICGHVLGRGVSAGFGQPARFIVYIDRTAGPWIEGWHGREAISGEDFDEAWQHDCLDEGWHPG
jgi:hypothetical protein